MDTDTPPAELNPPQSGAKHRLLRIISTAAVIVIVLALLWASYRAIDMVYATLQQQNQHLASSLSAAETELQRHGRQLQQLQQQLAQLKEQEPQRRAWALAKADYLAKLAAFTLAFQNDTVTTRKILAEADAQLRDIDDPKIWTVRQALTADMAALTATPTIDLPNIMAQLSAIIEQVEQLPRTPTLAPNTAPPTPPASAADGDALSKAKQFVTALSQDLKDLVIVQYETPTSPPLLPPDQYAYITTNIQFQLAMAQWAALRQQPDIYQQSINRAATWISRYFPNTDPAVTALLQHLHTLQASTIKPSTPDLSRSLQALDTAMAQG